MAISISGTLFSDEGVTPITSLVTLAVSVNGAAAAGTTVTLVDGTYTFAGITAAAAAVLTVYIQDGVNTQKAVTVTRSTGSDMTGIDLYQNYLNIRSDDSTPFSSTNMNTSDANGATGISAIYTGNSNTLTTLASGKHLLIMSGQTYAPGGSSTVTVTGNWVNNGTFTPATGTVTLKSTSSSAYFKTNGSSFNSLSINGVGGIYTPQDDISANSTITLTNGTLLQNGKTINCATLTGGGGTFTGDTGQITVTGSVSVTSGTITSTSNTLSVGGNFSRSGSGVFNHNNGTVTLNGTNQTIVGSSTFYNLTKTVPAAATLTFTDGTTQTVSNALTLQGASGQLLTLAGSSTGGWTLAVPSTQSLSYLDVSYSTATGNTAAAINSTNGGNNTNWLFVSIPVANFTGTPLSGTSPATVVFTDSSTNTPTSWLWEKNSGSGWVNFAGTPTAQNPSESFTTGVWSVRVTATNAAGSNTLTRTNYVIITAPTTSNTNLIGIGLGLHL